MRGENQLRQRRGATLGERTETRAVRRTNGRWETGLDKKDESAAESRWNDIKVTWEFENAENYAPRAAPCRREELLRTDLWSCEVSITVMSSLLHYCRLFLVWIPTGHAEHELKNILNQHFWKRSRRLLELYYDVDWHGGSYVAVVFVTQNTLDYAPVQEQPTLHVSCCDFSPVLWTESDVWPARESPRANIWTNGVYKQWHIWGYLPVRAVHTQAAQHTGTRLGAVEGLDTEELNARPVACGSSGWVTWGPGSCCCFCRRYQRPVCGSAALR